MIGAVVVVIAIVIAVAKPWESAPTTLPPSPSQAAVTITGPTSIPSAPAPTQAGPDWIAVTDAVTRHDAWGVTAVLGHGPSGAGATPATPRYTELWTPTATDPDGTDMAVVTRGGAEIAALGITVPDGVQPRAVRFWRLHQSNEFEWINAARIDNQAVTHAPLLVRMPLVDGVDSVPWEAGQYRVDVLTGDAIHRISVVIEKQFGDVAPDDWPVSAPDTVAPSASDPSAIRIGLFATVDGSAVSIPAQGSAPLDEVTAWADVALAVRPIVATIYLPRATGLGVMLTSHADVNAATIRRLAPDPWPDDPWAFRFSSRYDTGGPQFSPSVVKGADNYSVYGWASAMDPRTARFGLIMDTLNKGRSVAYDAAAPPDVGWIFNSSGAATIATDGITILSDRTTLKDFTLPISIQVIYLLRKEPTIRR